MHGITSLIPGPKESIDSERGLTWCPGVLDIIDRVRDDVVGDRIIDVVGRGACVVDVGHTVPAVDVRDTCTSIGTSLCFMSVVL